MLDLTAQVKSELGGAQSRIVDSIYSQCFPKQLAYVNDQEHRVAAICSRKAGKTGGKVRKMVATAFRQPENMVVYCATTIKSAMAAIWDNPDGLPTWLRRNHIPCKTYEEGLVEFPNGSLIRVTGAESKKTCDVWRTIRCNLWELDEGQAFDEDIISYLLEEVIPATLLVRGGQVSIGGTPDKRCRGYFFDVTTGKRPGWSVHHWTWRDNPHLRNAQEWVAAEMKNRGLDENTPAFRREFNGEWVGEDSALAYRFNREKNTFVDLPVAPDWSLILGVDQGYEDLATFTLGAWHSRSPVFYIREVYGERHCLPTRYAEIIKSYQRDHDITKIVMDCGALGKPIAEMLRREPYNLNIIAAEKKEKRAAQQMMNDSLATGRIKVDPKRCAPLIEQWQSLNVDEDGDEDQSQPNDYCDSALYAFRHASAHLAMPPEPPKPPPGRRPPPDPKTEAARMMERAEEYVSRQNAAAESITDVLGSYESMDEGIL